MNNLIARRESQTISINFLSIWLSQINNLIIQVMTLEKKMYNTNLYRDFVILHEKRLFEE